MFQARKKIYSAYAKEASARLLYQTAPKPLGEGGAESDLVAL